MKRRTMKHTRKVKYYYVRGESNAEAKQRRTIMLNAGTDYHNTSKRMH